MPAAGHQVQSKVPSLANQHMAELYKGSCSGFSGQSLLPLWCTLLLHTVISYCADGRAAACHCVHALCEKPWLHVGGLV
jgi:hypothetical protein